MKCWQTAAVASDLNQRLLATTTVKATATCGMPHSTVSSVKYVLPQQRLAFDQMSASPLQMQLLPPHLAIVVAAVVVVGVVIVPLEAGS